MTNERLFRVLREELINFATLRNVNLGTKREKPISLRSIVASTTRVKRSKTDCRAPRSEAIAVLVSVSVENFDSSSGSSEIKREFGGEKRREDRDKTEGYSRPLRATMHFSPLRASPSTHATL